MVSKDPVCYPPLDEELELRYVRCTWLVLMFCFFVFWFFNLSVRIFMGIHPPKIVYALSRRELQTSTKQMLTSPFENFTGTHHFMSCMHTTGMIIMWLRSGLNSADVQNTFFSGFDLLKGCFALHRIMTMPWEPFTHYIFLLCGHKHAGTRLS